jgi:hypothetical protein
MIAVRTILSYDARLPKKAMSGLDENLGALQQRTQIDPLDGLVSSRSSRSVIHG